MQTHVVHELEPIWSADSLVLILGTMPSPKSRDAGFYYAHPQNRFWPTLARVFDEAAPQSTEEKRALALRHRIAIWDVLKSCDIQSASDASIKNPVPNPLDEIISKSSIAHVYTTGQKAFQLYNKLCRPGMSALEAIALPSTSPANRRVSDEELLRAYSVLRTAVNGGAEHKVCAQLPEKPQNTWCLFVNM